MIFEGVLLCRRRESAFHLQKGDTQTKMYQQRSTGWKKHFDFFLIDIICLHLSFCIAYCLRFGWSNPYENQDYSALLLFLILMELLSILLGDTMRNIVKRGYWKEAKSCVKNASFFLLTGSLYMFATKQSDEYSRIVFFLTCTLFTCISYVGRICWKPFVRKHGSRRSKDSMLVVANADRMLGVLANLKEHPLDLPAISGLVVLDGEPGMEGFPYPVVANQQTMTAYITRNWVDELLVECGNFFDTDSYQALQKELDLIAGSGVAVHKIIQTNLSESGRAQIVEQFGDYTVMTDSIRIVSTRQALLKRCLDIAGGLVGCLLTGLILLFVGPMIRIKSPGPIIFKQTRIGRNGKPFTMYKIRSMCMDAEAKKKDLVSANRVADGMMFKLDEDPRIIGSKILPDGTYKKGIGNLIRDLSIDETPQFLNVLKGDMSLVGTRPPTLDEWEKYTPYHRARMTFRPGITGMWQISGRSDITDFDEVIRLDMQYINNWSAGMDFRILLETVRKVLKRDGAR